MKRLLQTAIVSASIACYFIVLFLMATHQGIVRPENSQVSVGIIALFGLAGFGVTALVCAVLATIRLIKRQTSSAIWTLSYAIVFAVSACISQPVAWSIVHRAELRDLEKIGVDNLRADTKKLIEDNRNKNLPANWYGNPISPSVIPASLRSLTDSHKNPVHLSAQGVFILTDGLGSFRGGYFITPVNSNYEPKNGSKITEGVYRIHDAP